MATGRKRGLKRGTKKTTWRHPWHTLVNVGDSFFVPVADTATTATGKGE